MTGDIGELRARAAALRAELERVETAMARNAEFLRGLPARFASVGEPGSRLAAQDVAAMARSALALADHLQAQVQKLTGDTDAAEREILKAAVPLTGDPLKDSFAQMRAVMVRRRSA